MLNQTYDIEFKLNHDGGFFTTGKMTVTFTTDQCSFTSSARLANEVILSSEEVTLEGESGLLVYPNPVQDILYIQQSDKPVSYNVFSVSGRKVLSGESTSIDVRNLNKGTYILLVNEERFMFIKN